MPGVKTRDALGIKDILTSGMRRLLRALVSEEPPPPAPQTTYLMQVPLVGTLPQVTTKKEVTPAERWDIQ